MLVGLEAVDPSGLRLGRVGAVEEGGGQVLLVVVTDDGEVLVPFHRALCPELDLDGRRVVIDAPEGLFDPVTWVDELESLPADDQAKIMGGNLAGLMGVAA